MITTVGTQMDATDPGALPLTQTRPGSTATSKFVVSVFVCVWLHSLVIHVFVGVLVLSSHLKCD